MKITANENDAKNMLQMFDNSCYRQCIVNWTAVILLQVLMVSQEKSAVKNEKREMLFR